MSKLSEIVKNTHKRQKKKHTAFSKLWVRAERLRQQNTRLRTDLDALIVRVEKEVRPYELKLGKVRRALVLRLIAFQRYKSLSRTQRLELRSWVAELLEQIGPLGLIDKELSEAVAKDTALELGVELDENSKQSVEEQLQAHLVREEEAEDERADEFFEKTVKQRVERRVKDQFGKIKPAKSETQDMFQSALDSAQQQLEADMAAFSQQAEAEIREEMEKSGFRDGPSLEDMFARFGLGDEEWDNEEEWQDLSPQLAKLDSSVFKRLFRKTANALHPDKEADENQRIEKQQLMGALLAARKQGDLLTIFNMHQAYVGDETELNASDEKQLLEVLKFHIVSLEDEELEIANQSAQHAFVYEHFYAKTKKARDRNIKEYISELVDDEEIEIELLNSLVNLKELKWALEDRYDTGDFFFPVDVGFNPFR